MATKQELEAKVKELENIVSQLKDQVKNLNSADGAKSILQKPVAGSQQIYFVVSGNSTGFGVTECGANNADAGDKLYSHGSIFLGEQQAKDFAEAINTLLLLRHCEGTVTVTEDTAYEGLWTAVVSGYDSLYAEDFYDVETLMLNLVPAFDTEDNLKSAIKLLGEENILKMMKTFNPIKVD